MAQPTFVPIRLLVHFQIATRPLVQVTDGQRVNGQLVGAGTRAVNVEHDNAAVQLYDPATGDPLGEHITTARALIILYSLAKRHP